jgi:4-hydroxy-tetrahydrodipicolinate reductase
MLKLVVIGAAGRMGRMLTGLIVQQQPQMRLGAAVEAAGHPDLGKDAGEIAGVGRVGIALGADYAAVAGPDTVALDFTRASASVEHLAAAAERGAAIVIGSTGFSSEMQARLQQLGPRTRTLIAPNMSLGVNLLIGLVAEAARVLADFDCEVVEIHHRTKLDAPSGTALALARAAADARGQPLEGNTVFGRHGATGVRPPGEIGVLALRAGDAVGDHTVIFGGPGERLELTHRTQSREALARGALRAAAWLERQPPGLYSMRDVLGL